MWKNIKKEIGTGGKKGLKPLEVSTTMTLTEVTYEISTPESSGTRAMSTCGHSDSDWFDWPPAFLKAHWINLQVGRKYA